MSTELNSSMSISEFWEPHCGSPMDTGFAVAKTERWKAATRYQVSSLAETEVSQVENSWGSDEANSATLICH